MNVQDLHNQSKVLSAFNSQTIAANGTTNGNIINKADFEAAEFILQSGALTDGAYAVTLTHGDDVALADGVTVPVSDLIGSIDFALADDNVAKRIGYIGSKQYVRLNIVATAVTAGGVFSGSVLLANGKHQPTANQ